MTTHIVVVSLYHSALNDWQYRLSSLNRCRMTGVDKTGRTIWFVSLANPERLRHVRSDSWEFSTCAAGGGNSRKREAVRRIMEARGIPHVETGEPR